MRGLLPSPTGHQTKRENVAILQMETDEDILVQCARSGDGNGREDHVESDNGSSNQLSPRFHCGTKIIQNKECEWQKMRIYSTTLEKQNKNL